VWRYPAAWDMLMFGLRLTGPGGSDPRCVVTTTPRPIRLIRELLADPSVAVTRGKTADNAAHLAPAFLAQIVRRYEGTRLGRQELDGETLEDMPGALWSRAIIEAARASAAPELARIIVAGADTGGLGYVLGDVSGRYAPAEWARAAITAYRAHAADRVVAEDNNG